MGLFIICPPGMLQFWRCVNLAKLYKLLPSYGSFCCTYLCLCVSFTHSILFWLLNPGATRKYRRRRFEVDRWVDTSTSERAPRGQRDVSTMAWFRPTESGLWLYKGRDRALWERAHHPISHAPQHLGTIWRAHVKADSTTASMLSMRRIRRKWYTEDKEGWVLGVHIRYVNQGPTRPHPSSSRAHFSFGYFGSSIYMETWVLWYLGLSNWFVLKILSSG